MAAERALAEARALDSRATADSWHLALTKCAEALSHWRDSGDCEGEAVALFIMGRIYDYLDDKHKALGLYDQALSLYRVTGDRSGQVTTVTNIGRVFDFLGEPALALEAVSPGEEPRVDPGDRSLDLPKWKQDLYHECLAQCLETLDQEQRAQLLLFYQGRGEGERKRIRKQLAQRLGTNTRALSSRILRLRSKLDRCIKSCVERRRLK